MPTYLFVGDSLTAGDYATVSANRYSSRICARTYATENNQGTGGWKTADALAAFPGSFPAADVTFIELGTNDFGASVTLATFSANYASLLSKVVSGTVVCLGIWKAPGSANSNGDLPSAFDAAIQTALASSGITTQKYVPLQPALYNNPAYHWSGAGVSTFLGAADTFHPNDLGHAAIATDVLRVLGTTTTTLQVGTYTATGAAFSAGFTLSDTFTLALDLNDQTTWLLRPGTLKMAQPKKSWVTSSNPRTPGERIVRAQYQNRTVTATFSLRGSTQSAMLASVRSLLAAIEQPPYVLRVVLPGGSSYSYLDVLKVEHDIPADPILWANKALVGITVAWECAPFLRGDRLYASNLANNPGFEAPFGGSAPAASTAPIAFNDTLANVNAYTVQAGSAPTTGPANTYVDVVAANGGANLLRYYRLGESSGTTANDIGGTAQHGTTHGSPTQGVAGLLSGDTDTCYTFASASSQYVSTPSSGLPSGNGAVSIGCWFKFAANPAANSTLMAIGNSGSAGQSLNLYLNTTGHLVVDIGGGGASVTSTGAVTTGAAHHALATWDGTTLTLYLDGASTGTPATPGAQSIPASPTLNIGANSTPSAYYSGQLDEACVWNAALTSTQVGNIRTAGNTGATGTVANAMALAGGTKVAYGSPSWGAIQTQQVRFRWNSAITTARFYLHRVDGSNDLEVTASGSSLTLVHRVGGTAHVQATAGSIAYIHEAWYWLQVTQFPTGGTNAPYVQVTLLWDDNGAVGTQIAQIAATTFDGVTALSGVSALGVDAGTLVVGGVSSGAGVRTYLFGPGGWQTTSGGTGTIAFAWEQNTANTAGVGTLDSNGAVVVPVTSFGAARMDFPPAGTFDGAWVTYKGGAPSGTSAIPATVGQVFGLKAVAKSSGLDGTASTRFWVQEWDASGTQVATTDGIGAVSGNLASWTALAATYTVTNASCAYISVAVRSGSSNAGSAGATVWFDNVQVWNQTRTGQTTMSYHELWFPNNPCQLLLSGLQGDVAAPAALSVGLYISGTWAAGSAIKLLLGRRQVAQAGAQLIGQPVLFSGKTGVLASTLYGGWYANQASMSDWQLLCLSQRAADALGTYHLLGFAQSALAGGNLPNLQVRVRNFQGSAPWATGAGTTWDLSEYYNAYITDPITAQNTWQLVDAGQAPIPQFAQGALNDPSGTYFTPSQEFNDTNVSHAAFSANWNALLPTDGALLSATLNNPSNSITTPSAQWLWAYVDGLYQPFTATQGGIASPGWTYSLESKPTANPSGGAGGPGTSSAGTINVNLAADPLLTVDPTVDVSGVFGVSGVNQLVVVANDATAQNCWALHAELQYSPLYLFPR